MPASKTGLKATEVERTVTPSKFKQNKKKNDMKKYIILATAALALAACNSEQENEKVWDGEIRLSSVSISQLTRAAGQDIQSTLFDSGENVDVFINENTTGTASTTYTQPLTYTTGTGGSLTAPSPQLFPSSGNGVNIYAVYPSGAASNVNGTDVAFSVKTDQSTDDNYKASDLMTGAPASNPVERTATTIPLVFKHCLTKINLNIYPGEGFTMDALAGAKVSISGATPNATFNVKTGAVTSVSSAGAGAPVIDLGTLNAPGNNPYISGSAIIIPQTIAAGTKFIYITIGVNPATNLVYTLPTSAATTFEAAKVYTFNITARMSGLSITSSTITDWVDGGTFTGDAVPAN